GIGVARGERRVVKRLFQFLDAHARIDALRTGTAGAPELDNAAGSLQPVAGRGLRGRRGVPRRFLGTGAEHKREEALLCMERGNNRRGQQQDRCPETRRNAHRVHYRSMQSAPENRLAASTAPGPTENTPPAPPSPRPRSSTARREIPAGPRSSSG